MIKNRTVLSAIAAILIVSTAVISGLQPIQATNMDKVNVLNLKVNPATIRAGDTFSINATIVNNSTNTISIHNGCGGPFSVVFDNHATIYLKKICNWMAVQIILKPGENTTVTSLTSNLGYNASSAGNVNANVTFSYDIRNQSSSDLSNIGNTISKSLLFTIYDKNSQTTGENAIMSPLEQFQSGTLAKNVQCRDGFHLVLKASNGSPACVKSSTVTKLVLWGWAKLINDTSPNSG
jgi:hypothetical protein